MRNVKNTEDLTAKVNIWISAFEKERTRIEYCENPWNPTCGSPDIQLYIAFKGRKTPVCRSCWQKIAETNLEW